MRLSIQSMDRASATVISTWHYDPPYNFYNMDCNDIEELRNGSYFAVVNEHGTLVGFWCVGSSAQVATGDEYGAYVDNGLVDIGLGMRPDLTGKGMGYEFVSTILSKVEALFDRQAQRLTVATFNTRAIRLYERLGFTTSIRFLRGDIEFITMQRK